MAYLYGNSESFPPDYDFIDALSALVTGAAQAARVAEDARQIAEGQEAARAARELAFGALDAFHGVTIGALAERLTEDAGPLIQGYVSGLEEHAAALSARLREAAEKAAGEEEAAQKRELGERQSELRAALAAFMVRLRLPVEAATYTLRLVGGHPELGARVTSPEGVEADFILSTAGRADWQMARKVLDFVSGLHLPLDVKKGWFSSSVQHQTVPVGDFYLGGFVVSEASAELRLRRKSTEDDAVVIELGRDGEGALTIALRRPGGEDAEDASALDPSAKQLLGELWETLRSACGELVMSRSELLSVSLGGEAVIASGQVVPLIQALVKLIQPTVEAIDLRSPNDGELTLKVEAETGRREELYIKKSDLAKKLEGALPGVITALSPLGFVSAPPEEAPPPPPSEEAPEGEGDPEPTDEG